MKTHLKTIYNTALQALFPRACFGCGEEGGWWCLGCEESHVFALHSRVCPFCGKSGSADPCKRCRGDVALDGVFSVGAYADPVLRKAITTWKFYGDPQVADVIRRWVQRHVIKTSIPSVSYTVSYVPLHVRRKRMREFDQAEEIAKMVGQVTQETFSPLLQRIRHTSPRAKVAQEKRRVGDFEGIFKTIDPIPPHVLLCDDVFTSGATMNAAAEALKADGAEKVWGFVLAQGR